MPTIPTGKMERELRRLYMQWVHQLPNHEQDLHKYVAKFQDKSMDLIEKMGGNVARLGALAGFPAPRRLDLSPHIGTIYSDMELAAISAQIGLGLNPRDTARALTRAGVDKSYRRLERLARTETVSAYWKNAWDSTEGLGLVMVWGAERGPRTCQWCLERDGLVMDSPDLRDHPNGRCTPLPTHPSQVEYKGSVDSSGRIFQDPAWTKKRKPLSTIENPLEGDAAWDVLPARVASDLTENQHDALRYYRADGYEAINEALRSPTGLTPEQLGLSKRNTTRFLNATGPEGLSSLTEALPKPIITYRGFANQGPGGVPLISPDIKPGAVLRDGAWASTSASSEIASGFMAANARLGGEGVLLEIRLPAGQKVIKDISDYEQEFILPPNQAMRVVSVEQRMSSATMGAYKHIVLEAIK